MTYLPVDGDRVTVTRTGPDGHAITWTGILADVRSGGFTLVEEDGRRVGLVGDVTASVLASGMRQTVSPIHAVDLPL